MAKVGDHVQTKYGAGTVITGKRVMLHGRKDLEIKNLGEKGTYKVIRTKNQVEEISKKSHQLNLSKQKQKSSKIQEVLEKAKEIKEKGIKAKPVKRVKKPTLQEWTYFDDDD